jgi:flagellar hook-associated protein 3 FlgL
MSDASVPDILSLSRLSRGVSDLKTRLNTTRTESVTGRYEDVTAQTKGNVGGALLLKKAIDDVKLFQSNLSLVESRAQITQVTLGNIGTEGSRIATDMLAAVGRDDESTIRNLAEDAKGSLVNTFASLNTKFAGRALFGGDETDRTPLAPPEQLIADIEAIMAGATDAADATAQLDTYFDDPTGGFATMIYQGSANRAPAVEIGPGVRIDVSAKADDPAIKDIIRGLATMAALKSATFADRDTVIVSGVSNVLDGGTRLTEQRAGIGVNEGRVAAAKARFEAEETVLTSLFNQKTARDPFEAASELQLLETQLEASYLMTARMARLSLTNFIR